MGESSIGADSIPSGSDTTIAGLDIVDPTSAANPGTGTADTTSDGGKRKRGRPSGSGGNAKRAAGNEKQKNPNALEGIEKILVSVHSILASATGIEELVIDDEESKSLANAVANVAKHYDVAPDPKTAAWINLATVAGAIYGTRIMCYRARISHEKRKAKKEREQQMNMGLPDAVTH